MSEPGNKAPEILPPDKPSDKNGRQQDLFPADTLQQMLNIEQQRIESINRRTDVALQAVKASDESDRRQFEFQMAKLDRDAEADKRRHGLAKMVTLWFGVIAVAVLSLFVYLMFFGSAGQSEIALQFLSTLAKGAAGFGIGTAVLNILQKAMRGSGGRNG